MALCVNAMAFLRLQAEDGFEYAGDSFKYSAENRAGRQDGEGAEAEQHAEREQRRRFAEDVKAVFKVLRSRLGFARYADRELRLHYIVEIYFKRVVTGLAE